MGNIKGSHEKIKAVLNNIFVQILCLFCIFFYFLSLPLTVRLCAGGGFAGEFRVGKTKKFKRESNPAK